jgi:1-phosphofructokinase
VTAAVEGSAFVFAPSLMVTVTIEPGERGPDIHIHAGGQGFWQARMIRELGVDVQLCGAFGGETGRLLEAMLADLHVDVRAVSVAGANGAYVHDRRSGEREELAEMVPPQLSRHEVDELYGAALVAGLEAGVCVLGGPHYSDVIPADVYRRLASDLGANGKRVVVDLAGEPLDAALEAGVTVLKLADEELPDDGRERSANELAEALRALHDRGAEAVVVTRAERPAVVLDGDELYEVEPPALEATDPSGAGDSLTAGLAAGLARGLELADAVRLGVAAGALNVTRRGLASGSRDEIERLAERIELRPLEGTRS